MQWAADDLQPEADPETESPYFLLTAPDLLEATIGARVVPEPVPISWVPAAGHTGLFDSLLVDSYLSFLIQIVNAKRRAVDIMSGALVRRTWKVAWQCSRNDSTPSNSQQQVREGKSFHKRCKQGSRSLCTLKIGLLRASS